MCCNLQQASYSTVLTICQYTSFALRLVKRELLVWPQRTPNHKKHLFLLVLSSMKISLAISAPPCDSPSKTRPSVPCVGPCYAWPIWPTRIRFLGAWEMPWETCRPSCNLRRTRVYKYLICLPSTNNKLTISKKCTTPQISKTQETWLFKSVWVR